ncbi:MAG: peptidylprolyl isomerase [Anaerolineales bacterium]|jgi:parvulin-like peptidyl-prolyl isomerase
MAKKDSQRTTLGKVGRVERERRYNRGIKIGITFVISVVVVVIIAGIVLEGFIHPKQPIAIVAGEEILTRDFQARVRFERGQLVSQYLNIYQYLELLNFDSNALSQYQLYLQQIQSQLDSDSIGNDILERMIDDVIIKNEAIARNIEVSDNEIDQYLESSFGYFPKGTPTPEPTLDIAPTSTFSSTQLSLVTLTPTPTETPTLTPDPEASPTPLPSPTIEVSVPTEEPYSNEDYQTDISTYFDNLQNDFKLSEDDLRKIISNEILRTKLIKVITTDLKPEQEQVWARHILVEDKDTALDIIDRLEQGEDWAALALEFSQDTSNASRGGDLGWFGSSTMVSEFSTAAFDTPIGEISEPVETSYGWHIIQVLGHETRPVDSDEFEQMKLTEFNNWLAEVRLTVEIEIKEYWSNRIPKEPSIPAQYIIS